MSSLRDHYSNGLDLLVINVLRISRLPWFSGLQEVRVRKKQHRAPRQVHARPPTNQQPIYFVAQHVARQDASPHGKGRNGLSLVNSLYSFYSN